MKVQLKASPEDLKAASAVGLVWRENDGRLFYLKNLDTVTGECNFVEALPASEIGWHPYP
jgi:hypothetical protein